MMVRAGNLTWGNLLRDVENSRNSSFHGVTRASPDQVYEERVDNDAIYAKAQQDAEDKMEKYKNSELGWAVRCFRLFFATFTTGHNISQYTQNSHFNVVVVRAPKTGCIAPLQLEYKLSVRHQRQSPKLPFPARTEKRKRSRVYRGRTVVLQCLGMRKLKKP
jgi:hypothetical protein